MSEMVERVARAIAQVREQNGAAPYDGWDAIHGEHAARRLREHLFEDARAAIAAMREPTKAMVEAGLRDDYSLIEADCTEMQWERMIDTALGRAPTS